MMKLLVQSMILLAMIACVTAGACDTNPCKNEGTCEESGEGYTCICTVEYIGTTCETVRTCDTNPCINGGTCEDTGDGFSCNCTQWYTGKICEIAGDDFQYWTESFTGQPCPWDTNNKNCAKCKEGGVQCPYHTSPNVCVMAGEYSQNLFCCHSLGLYATCDNQMTLYADGENIGELKDWSKSIFRQIDSSVSTIAIDCLDTGGWAAVLVSFSNGLTTNPDTWKCSKEDLSENDAWKLPGFEEGQTWDYPESVEKHGDGPWGIVNGMSDTADWIWLKEPQQGDFPSRHRNYCRTVIEWNTTHCEKEVEAEVGTIPPTTTTTTTPLPTTTTAPPTTTNTDGADSDSSNSTTAAADDSGNDGSDGDNSDSNNAGGADALGAEETIFGIVGSVDFIVAVTSIAVIAVIVGVGCTTFIIVMRRRKKKQEEDAAAEGKPQQAWK